MGSPLRVHAFIDGQNLFKLAKEYFGYKVPNYDPIELSSAVANLQPNRMLTALHFYTGIHKATENYKWNQFWFAKIDAIRRKGAKNGLRVEINHRILKYSEEEFYDQTDGKIKRFKCAREKGIDVLIALHLARLARFKEYDVAIIFSQDSDLEEAVKEVKLIGDEYKIQFILESAFPFSPQGKIRQGISRVLKKSRGLASASKFGLPRRGLTPQNQTVIGAEGKMHCARIGRACIFQHPVRGTTWIRIPPALYNPCIDPNTHLYFPKQPFFDKP